MLRKLRRASLATVVTTALILLPAAPVLAADAYPSPRSIMAWLLEQLPWTHSESTPHAITAEQTAPAPPSSDPVPQSPQLLDISGSGPASGQADSDALPDYDPDG